MLTQAIQQLYDVFASYEPSTLDQSCECCVSRADIDALRSKKLRKLTDEDLCYYSSKAMTTFGKVGDYKYFLPRLCELIATAWFPKEIEVVLAGKLEYAGFRNWPADERTAVVQYLHALWHDLLHKYPYHAQVDIVLCNNTLVHGSPANSLEVWSGLLPMERSARLHLASWQSETWAGDDGPPAFWQGDPAGWAQVVAWRKSAVVASVMRTALVEWSQTEEGEKWFDVPKSAELLEMVIRRWSQKRID